MKVGELRKILNNYDDELEVMIKKTELFGNVGYVNSVSSDTYARMGLDIKCVLLSDEYERKAVEE